MKDSLTYHPSSQGWAPRVLPLMFCVIFSVCVGVMGEVWLSFFSYVSFFMLVCYTHVFP